MQFELSNETRRDEDEVEKGIVNRGKGKGTRNGVSSPAGRRGRETRDVHLSRAPPAPGTPSHPTGIDHVFLLPAASYSACVHFTRTYAPLHLRTRTRTLAFAILPRFRFTPPRPATDTFCPSIHQTPRRTGNRAFATLSKRNRGEKYRNTVSCSNHHRCASICRLSVLAFFATSK